MPKIDKTGPENKGEQTGRGLGKCKDIFNKIELEQLGKGMGKRHNSGGGTGQGKRLKSGIK